MESTISAAPQISIDREKTLRSHRRYWVLRRAQDIVFSPVSYTHLQILSATFINSSNEPSPIIVQETPASSQIKI